MAKKKVARRGRPSAASVALPGDDLPDVPSGHAYVVIKQGATVTAVLRGPEAMIAPALAAIARDFQAVEDAAPVADRTADDPPAPGRPAEGDPPTSAD